MPRSTTFLALGLSVLLTACASRQQPPGEPEFGDSRALGIQVRVENQTPVSLRLFVMTGADETSLGRVGALSQMTSSLDRVQQGVMRLVARPSVDMRNGRAHASEPFTIVAGQQVTWILHASPGSSDLPNFSTIRLARCDAEDGC